MFQERGCQEFISLGYFLSTFSLPFRIWGKPERKAIIIMAFFILQQCDRKIQNPNSKENLRF